MRLSFFYKIPLLIIAFGGYVLADNPTPGDSTQQVSESKKTLITVDSSISAPIEKSGISFKNIINFKRATKRASEIADENKLAVVNKTSETKPKKKPIELRFSGYARMWGFYRNMYEFYPSIRPGSSNPDDLFKEWPTLPVNLSLSDGYQEPLALIRIEGNPSLKTWFQMEYYFDHRVGRRLNSIYNSINSDTNGRSATVYRIFQFTGGTHTKIGTFKLTAGGGVNWFKLSPFTLWQFQNRDDLFERYPWEPEGSDYARYNSYYSQGDIPRDQRWGNQGTQGFIIEATGLPRNFSAAIIYGKNQNSGGFVSGGVGGSTGAFANQPAQNMFAGKIGKNISTHKFGFNWFNQYGYRPNSPDQSTYLNANLDRLVIKGDSSYKLEQNRMSQLILTTDARLNFDNFKIFAELGFGSFLSPEYNQGTPDKTQNAVLHYLSKPWLANDDAAKTYRYKRSWDPALFLEMELDRKVLRVPLKVALYHIGTQLVNNTSVVQNTSIENFRASPTQGNANIINYFQGMVTEINQYANNRQGVNIMTGFNVKRLKVSIDYANAQEITNLYNDNKSGFGRDNSPNSAGTFTNGITFQHRVNQISRSRFGYFERYLGPYSRVMNIYRRTYENIQITDTDVNYKKAFSTMDLTLKYKFSLLGREMILSNYINYNSVQDKVTPIPVFSDQAFLRQFYQEFMAFYNIHPKVTVIGFVGFERALGNMRTELADANGNLITVDGKEKSKPVFNANGKPINQTGRGAGVGIDYQFNKRSSLNIRSRWFDHIDKNFVRDRFKGHEIETELKIFF